MFFSPVLFVVVVFVRLLPRELFYAVKLPVRLLAFPPMNAEFWI
jgi:hypothetical protein